MSSNIIKIFLYSAKRLEVWSWYFFVATITLSVRKILYVGEIRSVFNEYASIYIYLSDLALILVFLLFILNNRNYILSNIIVSMNKFKMFHVKHFGTKGFIVPRGTMFKNTYTHIVNNYWRIFPFVAVLFSFILIVWTTEWKISFFRSLKLLEFVLLYFYIIYNVPRGTLYDIKNQLFHVEQFHEKDSTMHTGLFCSTWNKTKKKNIVPRGTILINSLLIIVSVGFIQSIIGIAQFLLQRSVGLFWLKESIVSPSLPSVAKVILNGDVYIRSYGLFSHPNVLGGYLVLSTFITLFLIKLFHVEQKTMASSRLVKYKNCSTWNNFYLIFNDWLRSISIFVPRGTKKLYFVLVIQYIALFLTFSKSAIFGLTVGFIYLFFRQYSLFVPCGTNKWSFIINLFHVEQMKKAVLVLMILLFGSILIKPDINSLFIKSFKERIFYLNVSRGTILEHPFIGVGAGQFVFQIKDVNDVMYWQFQPVHNVFLLVLNEYGLFIFMGFLFFLYLILNCSTWNNLKKENKNDLIYYLKTILLSYIFIMMFDHYFWDIQQGSLMLWILLGILAKKGLSSSLHRDRAFIA